MRVTITIGWPEPVNQVWDDEVTDEQLGGIVSAFLEIDDIVVQVWKSKSEEPGVEHD